MGNNNTYCVDIAIVGAGIAGLWLLNQLTTQGYRCALFESNAIGAGQTIYSQGIIHGGIKYSLKGKLQKATLSIADMPAIWQACLQGQGCIDLSDTKTLSPHYYLWSTGHISSRLSTLLASKMLRTSSKCIKREDYPAIFQHGSFKGEVYKVDEIVVDVPSLINNLIKNTKPFIHKIKKDGCQLVMDNNHIDHLILTHDNNEKIQVKAKRYLFTAGEGNQAFLNHWTDPPAMQTRPLHAVMVKLEEHLPLYAHYIGLHHTPRVTVTSHTAHDGKTIWHLGGRIAEEGIHLDSITQCKRARDELSDLFPWIDFHGSHIKSVMINRAEGKQTNNKRPDSCTLYQQDNAQIIWPTKLVFSPKVGMEVMASLYKDGIKPSRDISPTAIPWPQPKIATPLWDTLLP